MASAVTDWQGGMLPHLRAGRVFGKHKFRILPMPFFGEVSEERRPLGNKTRRSPGRLCPALLREGFLRASGINVWHWTWLWLDRRSAPDVTRSSSSIDS